MADRTFRIQSAAGLRAAFTAAWNLAGELIKSGDGYELVIRKLKSKRSHEQNKRYWALLRELSAVAWIDGRQYPDQTFHEWFKRQFIGCEESVMPDGKIDIRGISTTALSIEQFGDYMTKIEQWSAENGFPLSGEIQ